jgi:hypothetical protein
MRAAGPTTAAHEPDPDHRCARRGRIALTAAAPAWGGPDVLRVARRALQISERADKASRGAKQTAQRGVADAAAANATGHQGIAAAAAAARRTADQGVAAAAVAHADARRALTPVGPDRIATGAVSSSHIADG